MLWTAYRTRTTFLTFPWGIRLTAAVQNNGVINAGTVGLSNSLELGQNPWEELGQNARSQSECLQHAVSLILWESSRLAEQPTTGVCLRAPPSMVLQQPGEGSRAVFLLGSSTVQKVKNRRKYSLLGITCSVVLGRVWKTEFSNEMSVQSIPQLACVRHWMLKSRYQLPAQKSIFSFWKYQNAESKCPKSETN